MLSVADLHHRVVIRRIVAVHQGRPRFSDLLGELVDWSDDHAVVRTDSGAVVTVPRSRIAVGKRVPPRRPRLGEVFALERVAAEGWPAPDTRWLGQWLLRAAEGWTNRANSVLVLGDPGLPLPEAMAEVYRWYAERGLQPRFVLTHPGGAALAAELRRLGWEQTHRVQVRTASLAALQTALQQASDRRTPHQEVGDVEVRVASQPSPAWLRIAAGAKGELPPAALAVLTGPSKVGFLSVTTATGEVLGIVRAVVTAEWVGVSLLEVIPEVRRRGLGRSLMGAAAQWGAERGAQRVYLQVEETNHAAIQLYAGLGLTIHHEYTIHRPPPQPDRVG